MACCCKLGQPHKATSCLGRCDLPKHRCLDKCDIRPGPIPRNMGWLWDARTSPEHQLRCGWRPGHVYCPVLKTIELHNICTRGECLQCPPRSCSRHKCGSCGPPKSCYKSDCGPPALCMPLPPSPCCGKPTCGPSLIRIIRHAGTYSISMKPSNTNNSPSGPCPLRYVVNTDPDDNPTNNTDTKYSVEAKFNDYHFDYTTSQTSFVLDFSPPDQKCYKPCPRKSLTCLSLV